MKNFCALPSPDWEEGWKGGEREREREGGFEMGPYWGAWIWISGLTIAYASKASSEHGND